MPFANPRKHLTTAQRIRVIEYYIKATFTLQDNTTYIIPPITLPKLAADATSKLGFEVNDNQLTGCLKVMEEMGFSVIRPPVTPNARVTLAALEYRVRELEDQVAKLTVDVVMMRFDTE